MEFGVEMTTEQGANNGTLRRNCYAPRPLVVCLQTGDKTGKKGQQKVLTIRKPKHSAQCLR